MKNNNKNEQLAITAASKLPAKRVSGVDPSAYKQYKFEDHIWFKSPADNTDLIDLVKRCVKVDGTYYLFDKNNSHCMRITKDGDQKKHANNVWLEERLPSGTVISEELIETFFSGVITTYKTVGKKTFAVKTQIGSCPILQQTISIPLGPKYVTLNGSTALNTWVDEMITGDVKHLNDGKAILRMIYRCLCAGEQLDTDSVKECDMLLQQVIDDQWTNLDFRFVMNWLAALVQRPGYNITSNLWLCGTREGVGKGTLVKIMKEILGASSVGKLNISEVERGWNDHLQGKQLVEIDEFEEKGKMTKKDWNTWIKANTCEPVLSIAKRNSSSYTVINVSNFIITTNEEEPLWLGKSDRRNQFVRTWDSPKAVAMASALRGAVDIDPIRWAKGLAYILERVTVDWKFISKAHINDFKQEIIDSSLNIVEEWFANDVDIKPDVEMQASQAYDNFKSWFRFSNPSGHLISMTAWGKLMKAQKRVLTEKRRNVTYYTILSNVVEEQFDLSGAVESLEKITGQTVPIEDLDVKKSPITGLPELSKMQKLRAKLIRQEEQE